MVISTFHVWIAAISICVGMGLALPLTNSTCHKNETWIPIPREHWPHFNVRGLCRNVTPDTYIPCGNFERWVRIPPSMKQDIDFNQLCDTTVKGNERLYRNTMKPRVGVLPTSARCIPYPAALVITLVVLLILSLLLNTAFALLYICLVR